MELDEEKRFSNFLIFSTSISTSIPIFSPTPWNSVSEQREERKIADARYVGWRKGKGWQTKFLKPCRYLRGFIGGNRIGGSDCGEKNIYWWGVVGGSEDEWIWYTFLETTEKKIREKIHLLMKSKIPNNELIILKTTDRIPPTSCTKWKKKPRSRQNSLSKKRNEFQKSPPAQIPDSPPPDTERTITSPTPGTQPVFVNYSSGEMYSTRKKVSILAEIPCRAWTLDDGVNAQFTIIGIRCAHATWYETEESIFGILFLRRLCFFI